MCCLLGWAVPLEHISSLKALQALLPALPGHLDVSWLLSTLQSRLLCRLRWPGARRASINLISTFHLPPPMWADLVSAGSARHRGMLWPLTSHRVQSHSSTPKWVAILSLIAPSSPFIIIRYPWTNKAIDNSSYIWLQNVSQCHCHSAFLLDYLHHTSKCYVREIDYTAF